MKNGLRRWVFNNKGDDKLIYLLLLLAAFVNVFSNICTTNAPKNKGPNNVRKA